MAFRHGVYKSEVPTSILAPTQTEAGLPVIIGTAPVFMADKTAVNVPKLCYSYEEAVQTFGYSDDWDSYTLCEFIYSHFALFAQAPCVLINVFDPAKHFTEEKDLTFIPVEGTASLGQNVISADSLPLTYDDDGNACTASTANSLKVSSLKRANPKAVSDAEIIGGVSATTGKLSGLELVNDVFPKFRLVPGLIGAPKYSTHPGVAAVMRAKADSVSGLFTACAVVDIPSDSGGAKLYTDAPNWKEQHNYVAERMIVCWPKVALDGKVFHMSTQLISLMNKIDHQRGDVPYKSPSNELLQMDSCVNASGEEVFMSLEQANYLNSQGIVSAVNWIGGWRAWGNRTGTYPAVTDVKDCFIPVRRMIDFLGNQFILTFWQEVDGPITRRMIRRVVNTFNMYMNGLEAREMILGGRVEFKEDENGITDLLNGILRFHIYVAPPVPAEMIEGILEYDPDYLSVLSDALR